jgi:hypothetical protein
MKKEGEGAKGREKERFGGYLPHFWVFIIFVPLRDSSGTVLLAG